MFEVDSLNKLFSSLLFVLILKLTRIYILIAYWSLYTFLESFIPPLIALFLQEEVLAQQRLEQQRQTAATVDPSAPVDPGEFLQTLPPSLRQSLLAEMEESQISALPAEIAAEAQTLRRDFEQRNRALMHERFFNHVNHPAATLSSILRSTVNRMGGYTVHSSSTPGTGICSLIIQK